MQNNKSYIEEITNDGSPTLKLKSNEGSESMHHSGGAASETIYIYGNALAEAQKLYPIDQTRYLVLGLGLGYIEILISLMTDFRFSHITSFEKDLDLIQNFKRWMEYEDQTTHNSVLQSLLQKMNMNYSQKQFKDNLKRKLNDHKIEFKNALQQRPNLDGKLYHVVCYDAFSKKMDELLWNYEFLDYFIKQYCDEFCVFSSYAKTGTLSRVLKDNSFTLIQRSGFSGKRESTLAVRRKF